MKAFIFNSGVGNRLGDMTKNTPKALVKLTSGETILGRQIRLLSDNGIKDFVITTGPFHNQIEEFVSRYDDLNFVLVNSDKYLVTNSIYSMHISRDYFDSDFLILHGDLVFDNSLVKKILNNEKKNLVLINRQLPKPEKDFKGRVSGSFLRKISVNIFDNDCYALQPFYKMESDVIKLWLAEIQRFISNGNVNVYAETALNNLLSEDIIEVFDYSSHLVDEIDNPIDHERVSQAIRERDYKDQVIITTMNFDKEVCDYLTAHKLSRPLVVHGKHIQDNKLFMSMVSKLKPARFSDFSPNPKYNEIIQGLHIFNKCKCDSIIAIGGGSCIDVAKAIKAFSVFETTDKLINLHVDYVDLKFICVPTTAGTGSEATKYSVFYYNGKKMSLSNDSLLPDLAILSPNLLADLPLYQRKSTLLDAFCQAIEGFWSVNSTATAKKYSEDSLTLILKYYKSYIEGDNHHLGEILLASNLAGKSINISQTTAPHALSYMITTITGVSHGHAVSLTLPHVYNYMTDPIVKFTESYSSETFKATMTKLSHIFNIDNYLNLGSKLSEIIASFGLDIPKITFEQMGFLVASVNQERLKNTPVYLDSKTIRKIYFDSLNIQ